MSERYHVGSVVLDNWVLEREIGSGGYGVVYEARREEYGTVYKSAIKIITVPRDSREIDNVRAGGMDERSVSTYFEGIVENIVKEVALMSRFKGDSNIVSYEDHRVIKHDTGIGWDVLIRMELLTPLAEYLKNGEPRYSDVLRLGIGICNALERCHAVNVIHRDVKQENIFVSDRGDYKLGDFSVARRMELTGDFTPNQSAELYMAPEVRKEEKYGPTVDIYSLGIVLYRLLNNNRMPFMPEYPQQFTHTDCLQAETMRISGKEMPLPRNADEKLGRIILKACAYNPEDRYSSVAAMRMELQKLLDEHTSSTLKVVNDKKANEKMDVPPASDKDKKKGRMVTLILVSLLAICGGVLWMSLNHDVNVEVNLPDAILMCVGDDSPLPYSVTPEISADENIAWTCSNDEVLHVVSGTLIGRSVGQATVRLTCGKAVDSCQVWVVDRDLGGVIHVLNDSGWYFKIDGQTQLGDAMVQIDEDLYFYDDDRSVSDEQLKKLMLAASQQLGEYTRKDGNAWISVYSDSAMTKAAGTVLIAESLSEERVIVVNDGLRTYILRFDEVIDPATVTVELQLSEAELMLEKGGTFTLNVKGIQKDDSVVEVDGLTWISSDDNVCTVKDGVITAVAAGTAKITVSDGNVSTSCVITVQEPETEPPTEAPTEPPKAGNETSSSNKNTSQGSSSKGSSSSSKPQLGMSGDDSESSSGGQLGMSGDDSESSSGGQLGMSD